MPETVREIEGWQRWFGKVKVLYAVEGDEVRGAPCLSGAPTRAGNSDGSK